MNEVSQLHEALLKLEGEVERYQHNCARVQEYQQSILDVCEVWARFLDNAAHMHEHAEAP
eukprot:CAMPEP_0198342704 /NCGR_PEP_ID=MMETSP1450-20131203/54072_1 /TAXON_ID=753684 ORGANISM="Madagascaria erythrocladiodes, Strain CCMP3234" /NCGR_SAMPLE_ID=MMETSP1450 /ASSEMBLY_ACC=CAM_ASM_001115 /LENGTH=59 /DNA_ID=CAMNT_0044047813 /DNA_START=57 /DNA_END=233 /DNA_ORIENTATION=+